MALERFIKGRQINDIDWNPMDSNDLLFCFNEKLEDIRIGSKLNVAKGQIAFIVHNDEVLDLYKEGQYYLDDNAMPKMMKCNLINKDTKTFRTKIIFISTIPFDNQWLLSDSISIEDIYYANIDLQMTGSYSIELEDHLLFFKYIYETYFKKQPNMRQIVKKEIKDIMNDQLRLILGKSPFTLEDIYKNEKSVHHQLVVPLINGFSHIGLNLKTLYINSIVLPETILKIIEERLDKEELLGKVERESIRTCKHCGVVLSEKALFCAQCGAIYRPI